jgi:hypothetical protein
MPTATSTAAPKGHLRRRYAVKRTEDVVAYRGEAVIGNACPVTAQCTTSDPGRKVQRSLHIDYLERVRTYHVTEAYKKAIRKRQVWVEPRFAAAKEWHGGRRLRWRGLLNSNIQGLLIAAGQNLKRLLAATSWEGVTPHAAASWGYRGIVRPASPQSPYSQLVTRPSAAPAIAAVVAQPSTLSPRPLVRSPITVGLLAISRTSTSSGGANSPLSTAVQ